MDALGLLRQQPFPLKPMAMFVGGQKIILDSGPQLHFAAHKVNTREFFHSYKNSYLFAHQFDEIVWNAHSRFMMSLVSLPCGHTNTP